MGGSRSHSDFFLGNLPKIALNHFGVVCHVCSVCRCIAKVVGYYVLSVLSMSVMGFKKKKFGWMGVGAISKFFFGLLDFF